MKRVIPVAPEEIKLPSGLSFTDNVKFHEDGSISLYGNGADETRIYAHEVHSYFKAMVEGTLKQMKIPFRKLTEVSGCDKATIYKLEDPKLQPIIVFHDGESTTMTGNLYETLRFGESYAHYRGFLASGRRKEVVQDFRRFLTNPTR